MENFKCPYCAGEVNKEARICKHCNKDLISIDAKNLINQEIVRKKKIEEEKERIKQDKIFKEAAKKEEERKNKLKQKLLIENKSKIEIYPFCFQEKLKNDLDFLIKLIDMDNEAIEDDITKRYRYKNIDKITIASIIILGISLFIGLSWFFFILIIVSLIVIWIFPEAKNRGISFNEGVLRLSNYKNFKNRCIYTIIVIIIMLFGVYKVINGYIENQEIQKLYNIEQEEIKIENERVEKEKIEKAELKKEEDRIEKEQKLKEESTKLSADFNINIRLTTDSVLNIPLKFENILELYIDDEKVDIEGKESLEYKYNLKLGDNNINIIGNNGDIIRKKTFYIQRVTEDELKKIESDKIIAENKRIEDERIKREQDALKEKERIKEEAIRKEEATKLGISYNQVLKDIPYIPMKKGANMRSSDYNINGKENYIGTSSNLDLILQIIGNKDNISQASVSILGDNIEGIAALFIFLRNILPGELEVDVINDIYDNVDLNSNNRNYEKKYGNKILKYSSVLFEGVIMQSYTVSRVK